jgi:hypothetical protein
MKVEPYLLSDHLAEALYRLNLAREAMRDNPVRHREAALHALVEAEKSIAHVIGLIAERVE